MNPVPIDRFLDQIGHRAGRSDHGRCVPIRRGNLPREGHVPLVALLEPLVQDETTHGYDEAHHQQEHGDCGLRVAVLEAGVALLGGGDILGVQHEQQGDDERWEAPRCRDLEREWGVRVGLWLV